MTNAQAQPYYNDDGMHDNNNYYKSEKDNSKSVSINKIKCINSNLNINDINSGDVNIGNKGQGYLGADSYTGYYDGHGNNNKQGKNFDCVINNNNTNSDIVSTIPPEPEPTTATLKVTKQLTCDDSNAREGDCEQLLELITEDQFTFRVEGNNPVPSSTFPGSTTGTDITLGPGNYAVLETLEESVSDDIQTFVENNPDRALMLTLESSFTGDCTFFQTLPLEAEARGTIDAGESQTCNAINPFLITDITPPPP